MLASQALLQVSDSLTAMPFRVIALHDSGQLSAPQAVNALQRAIDLSRTGWTELAGLPDHQQSRERTRLIARLGPQIQTLSLLLERLEEGLRDSDSALTHRLLTQQLAPASRDLMQALNLLAREPFAAEPDPEPVDWLRPGAAPAAGLLLAALGLLLRRRPPPLTQRIPDDAWRQALDGSSIEQGIARLMRRLVAARLADLACEARIEDNGDPLTPPRLVVRHAAAGPGLPPTPVSGDLLLLPGRNELVEQLRQHGPLELGGRLSDLGTTFAWPGYFSCSRALLLPLWRGPHWHGCLALFMRSTAALEPVHREYLLAAADQLSVRLGRSMEVAKI